MGFDSPKLHMQVLPISMTSFDWPTFIRRANEVTGRSPTRNLDSAGIKLDKPAAFVLALDTFAGNDRNVAKIMQRAGTLLRHVTFGFLIDAHREEYEEFMLHKQDISVTSGDGVGINDYLIVATGTVYAWRQMILDATPDTHGTGYREILNLVHFFLDQAGFSDLWRDYRKRSLNDGTFILEPL